jgi:hypothetical protein
MLGCDKETEMMWATMIGTLSAKPKAPSSMDRKAAAKLATEASRARNKVLRDNSRAEVLRAIEAYKTGATLLQIMELTLTSSVYTRELCSELELEGKVDYICPERNKLNKKYWVPITVPSAAAPVR